MLKYYEKETLDRLHDVELEILQDFAATCEKYNLNYFALYGTAIGAVRHKGFIPWDDDIDVGMTREDYTKFEQIWEKDLGGKYRLTNPKTDANYCSGIVKLQKNGTKFVPPYAVGKKTDLSMHIDIFIFDNYIDDSKKRAKQVRKARLLSYLMFLRFFSEPEIKIAGIKGGALKLGCKVVHGMLTILCISPRFLYRKFEKNAQKYNDIETEYLTSFQDTGIEKGKIRKTSILPIQKLPFEDIQISMINDYETNLRNYFGDYMQLPPEEDRVNHAPEIIEF